LRKLVAFIMALAVTLGVVTATATTASAYTAVLYSSTYGNGIGVTRDVPSTYGWHAGDSNHTLKFQTDCNLVEYWGTHGAWWATNTVTSLRPCHWKLQQDNNLVIYRSNGSVAYATNTVHNGTEAFVLLTNGCVNMYHLTGGYVHPERQLAGTFGTDLTTCDVTVA